MITVHFQFPGKRYHATPWGHHVNEGLIEWPPSPWRLLRALLATGYSRCGWPPEGPPEIAIALFEKLGAVLPSYRLPRATGAHTRHYMPTGELTPEGREKTTLVFDTWAQVHTGVLTVSWDVTLEADETRILRELVTHMSYLGRSESWVTASLRMDNDTPTETTECIPCEHSAAPGPKWAQVPLMAPEPPTRYHQWLQAQREKALAPLPKPADGKKPTQAMRRAWAKALAPFPEDWVSALQAETDWLQKQGWSQPPGSRKVFYWRQKNAIETAPLPTVAPCVPKAPVTLMLFSFSTQTGNRNALPPAIRTLPQAERLHTQYVGALNGRHSRVLTGCDEEGRPLRLPHTHAHLLPLDMDGDRNLDHLMAWAPMGFTHEDQSTLIKTRTTFAKGGIGPIRVTHAGSGHPSDFRALRGQLGRALQKILAPDEGACTWESLTPFLPPRYMKKSGKNTLERQLRSELTSRGFPEPTAIHVQSPQAPRNLPFRHFIKTRKNGPAPKVAYGFSITLTFATPIWGPLCLGYGSHFGLGLFKARLP